MLLMVRDSILKTGYLFAGTGWSDVTAFRDPPVDHNPLVELARPIRTKLYTIYFAFLLFFLQKVFSLDVQRPSKIMTRWTLYVYNFSLGFLELQLMRSYSVLAKCVQTLTRLYWKIGFVMTWKRMYFCIFHSGSQSKLFLW